MREAEPQPPCVKEDGEEPQPPCIKEEEEEPQIPCVKVEEEELQPTHIKEEEEEPQPTYVKEEEEELSITQEGEHLLGPEEADHGRLPLTGVSVKTEDPEDKPPESSQLHHSPSEEMREAEPSCSSSLQHMTTEADGDHCGGSQTDNLLAPLSDSDDTTSHSPEGEDNDFTQESLSSDTDCEGDMMTHTGNKHSESSKKKTGVGNPQLFNLLLAAYFAECDIQQLIDIQHHRVGAPLWSRWSDSQLKRKRRSPTPPMLKRKRKNSPSLRRESIF
ncbi:myb-like protein X isoform X5 [Dunckerocampus dactyliophorus]|uniref:myb-like protein X isoform X5 n=1 Tax=Dunckerocampus dactyliophorus TaxID=161453 RepID=UPI002406FA29|nr:myb-like protein X isoform X5 [Dunckerocampus dactyliophorus]